MACSIDSGPIDDGIRRQSSAELIREARIHGRNQRWNDAIDALRDATELDPNDAEAHFLLGSALDRIGDPSSAVSELERARALDPDDYRIYGKLGIAYRELERLDDAEASFRELVTIEPGDAEAWGMLGSLGYDRKRYPLCVEGFSHYVALIEELDPALLPERQKERFREAHDRLRYCRSRL